ncbi:hypothetical protein HI914_03123 [Erysiphe necator]|nr:hypothetical protein HI914_03123 [Erysiphe necator]
MSDFGESFVHTLALQSWIAYSIGMLFIFLRMYARIRRLGMRGLQADDYLMILVAALYTTLVVCLNIIAGGGGSNLYLPEDFITFTPEQIQDRIQGSKIVVISEQAMLNVIYTIKTCMLIIYSRLTLGLQIRKMLVYLSVYVAVGWVSTQIAFFTACRPFAGYWAMPPPNPQCTTLEHYAIVQGCFNISSDILMLSIPLPLITKLNVPLKQKSVLLIIFSMGIFVIIAALLTKIFNLSNVWDPSYMLWYVREASVAVYVSNLPLIWPMLREWFPTLKALAPRSRANASQTPKFDTGASTQKCLTEKPERRVSKAISENAIITVIKGQGDQGQYEEASELDTITKQESVEHFDPTLPYHELPASEWDVEDQRIHMTTTVHISEEHLDRPSTERKEPQIDNRRSESPEMASAVGYSWLRD